MVQISSVAAGVSSFCFPGRKVPAWFVQQNSAASVTIQLMLVGGKTKRCRDNKRDKEAEPGGSGFKNGAESTTNDSKVYSRRPKRFKEIK